MKRGTWLSARRATLIEMAAIAIAKTVFNEEEMTIDYGRKRATYCKHNISVKLPDPKSNEIEEGIEWLGNESTESSENNLLMRRVSRRAT